MTTSWDRQTDETEEWYDRFAVYLYMGPDRTVAAAHAFATRFAKGAVHGHLSSWRRAAQRYQWQARAVEFDAELCRKALASDERLRMVAELLHQVYGVLRQAELLTLTKEEARQLLPTFRLFFRDLLQFHQTEAAQFLTASEGGGKGSMLSADELVTYLTEKGGLPGLFAEIERVTEAPDEASWRLLRDVLAQLYADEASARRIAAQAHLDSARIRFSARAVDSWHAILTEAANVGLLDEVIAVVQEEYRGNGELAKAVRQLYEARLPMLSAMAKNRRVKKGRGKKPTSREQA